jgi:hypothetical protein
VAVDSADLAAAAEQQIAASSCRRDSPGKAAATLQAAIDIKEDEV